MRRLWVSLAVLAALAITGAGRRDPDPPVPAHPPQGSGFFALRASEIAVWDAWLQQKVRVGELRLLRVKTGLGGLRHERFQQYSHGYPVFGAQVLRHWKDGKVAWINGRFFEDVPLKAVFPSISEAQAVTAVQQDLKTRGLTLLPSGLRLGLPSGRTQDVSTTPRTTLVVLPWPPDEPRAFYLAYQVDVVTSQFWAYRYFIDALTGEVIGRLDRSYSQTAVGLGRGQWYLLKVPLLQDAGAYFLADPLRPSRGLPGLPGIAVLTFNDRNECCPDDRCLGSDHIGQRRTDVWNDDPAEVDAHARAGWVLDFYHRVFQRDGIDGRWIPAIQVVHFCQDYLNAFFTDAFFPDFGLMVYGDGVPGFTYPFTAGFDVIAHEFTHGVTASESDLIYFRESGALNESFSDVMAAAAEFMFEPEGSGFGRADWLLGEDLFKAPWPFCPRAQALRSFIDPENGGCGYQPSHYVNRYLGSDDNGGVHINSGIPNHAFYLLAVGGRHRLSGVSVPAVGLDKVTRIFYVGFVDCLTPTSVFRDARSCTALAARNLYGPSEEGAVHMAWDAVGVPR